MKNLFVVTHTQSTHHVENRFGGWHDTGLAARGEADARVTGHQLAAIIANRFLCTVETTSDLRELSYGSAGGMPQEWHDVRQILMAR